MDVIEGPHVRYKMGPSRPAGPPDLSRRAAQPIPQAALFAVKKVPTRSVVVRLVPPPVLVARVFTPPGAEKQWPAKARKLLPVEGTTLARQATLACLATSPTSLLLLTILP